jgi:SERRATE/Ars2, N-terminal domain
MAIDEFGREVPAAGRGPRSPPHYAHDEPIYLNGPLPSGRHEERGLSSYNGGNRPSYDHNRSSRKRKQLDDSSGPSMARRSGTGTSTSSTNTNKNHNNISKTPHPATLYVEEPMLCQFLWKEKEDSNDDQGYEDYRKGYCLNYIRTFFNQHLDDSWFRSLYSPLEQYRVALQERNRARGEAEAFMGELQSSMGKNVGDKSKCFFILAARLGGGTKFNINNNNNNSHDYISPGKMSSSLSNPIPGTHVMNVARQVLQIQEVPPHVSDHQLVSALVSHVKGLKRGDLQVYSSDVPGNGNLFRTAFIQCSDSISKDIIQQLNHTTTTTTTTAEGVTSHVPRKEDTYVPNMLQLEVECSDAYGRLEVDADGKGGDGGDEEAVVTPRKATVWISTQTTSSIKPYVAVLSAAVSSKVHFAKDCEAALTLTKAYDVRNSIPAEVGFQSVLDRAFPNFSLEAADLQDVEDTLDLAVAYLRRVHLVSFYNGCAKANRVADVLNGSHAASTIHLRLDGADDIFREAAKEEPPTDAPLMVDLLVQRHTFSIENALKEAQEWLDESEKWQKIVVSPEVDSAAQRIEREEAQVEPIWIKDHSVIDEDGRARCSFHFCRKLFKDSTFLKKHLLKKHSEFLKSERAKCHDQSMMQAWDAQECRPVPPIFVDCGRAFSLVCSPVVGAAVPLAEDPEPELWRRQQERRDEDERIRKEREERFEPPDPNAPLLSERTSAPRRSHFVDVDDMKEDKVEISFDHVEVPILPVKKKRKKKLL